MNSIVAMLNELEAKGQRQEEAFTEERARLEALSQQRVASVQKEEEERREVQREVFEDRILRLKTELKRVNKEMKAAKDALVEGQVRW